MDDVIAKQIVEKMKTVEINPHTLIVLKGIPLKHTMSEIPSITLDSIINDKLKYFNDLVASKRQFITYEEFLLLADFIVAQYKKVYIINNNLYINAYYIEDCFLSEVKEGLLAHFTQSEDDDEETIIGEIDEYLNVFAGLEEYEGCLIGAYIDSPILDNEKICHINLFDNKTSDEISVSDASLTEFDLIEEKDYVKFVQCVYAGNNNVYVRITNYIGNVVQLKEHISLINHYWQNQLKIYYVQADVIADIFDHRPEYTDILKKYWGYTSYRNLSVYDMNELDRGNKKVNHISQEKIIADLVTQVENCGENKSYNDIFITAPTGAGKSIMFQVPAIYLAEKYNLLTLVISPLIGLMNDQVKNLELKEYHYAKTINSDISPIIKEDIIAKVSSGQYHILYLSPETLLSRSDVSALIGNRTIGMIVIDEAHIVTTWGKQFRPDYWYLGDYIRKLRNNQSEKQGCSFVIATFTATAIYSGIEDMYAETRDSLHMRDPITYLGFIKRNDIKIDIKPLQNKTSSNHEYEFDKFEQIEQIIHRAIITEKKTLIYFPTVSLMDRCYEYFRAKEEKDQIAIYHGRLNKDKKQKNYEEFSQKQKLIMFATKAFGMGIDIDDIEIVAHFAPTGSVCDYVQEIGRAARREDIIGEAIYHYTQQDFKHINRLYGLTTIRPYQLIKVIEKILNLYLQSRKNNEDLFTKKRRAMLIDAENFTYIFECSNDDENTAINKVKTALLLIQKDFEAKRGYAPIHVRPIPMFSRGYFEIEPLYQKKLQQQYPNTVEEINKQKHICNIKLKDIWENYYKKYSFPKFKYLLYTQDAELDLVKEIPMSAVLRVDVRFDDKYQDKLDNIWGAVKKVILDKVQLGKYFSENEITELIEKGCKVNKYKAQAICEVLIASINLYAKVSKQLSLSPIVSVNISKNGTETRRFNNAINSYFRWIDSYIREIKEQTKDNILYLINDNNNKVKGISIVLGLLETIGCLTFKMLGGTNSQIYIYVNETQSLRNILNDPSKYENKVLKSVAERHAISVKMLTYIYEGNFSNDELWNLLEDYFLGVIPKPVKQELSK